MPERPLFCNGVRPSRLMMANPLHSSTRTRKRLDTPEISEEWHDSSCKESGELSIEFDIKTTQKERRKIQDQVITAKDDVSYAQALRGTIYLPSINLEEEFDPPVYPKTPAEEAFLKSVLRNNFLFSDLSNDEIQKLINAMGHECYCKVCKNQRKTIIRQGDVGDFFYIVESGKVDFILDGVKHVGACGPGGCFGGMALLYNSPRAVSCVAASDTVELFRVDQKTFRSVLAHHASDHASKVKGLLKRVSLLAGLDDDDLSRLAASLTHVQWKKGDRIFNKGEEGKVFYIVQEGTAKIHDIGLGDSCLQDQIVRPGDWFGERALLTGEPRAATATALTQMTTMALDRDTFENILGPLQHVMERDLRCQFLKGLPLFGMGKVTDLEFSQLADSMKELCFRKGEKLAEAGKPYEMKLWYIRHGRLVVSNNNDESYVLESGDTFGEKSIVGEKNRISSHTAVCEENLTAWVITRKDIESIVGDLDRLGDQPQCKPVVDKTVQLSGLTRHKVLGRGAFGKVFLVSRKSNGDNEKQKKTYALKSISKHELVRSGQVDSAIQEKEMLSLVHHPFIIPLVSSFQDENYVSLLLPVVPGGELFDVLHSQHQAGRTGLPNRSVAFYAACIIEALGYLHQRNIAYRDLKLENVLIDAEGYCTLVDLGFAKVVPEKTYTLVGTPEYLAPEIIMSKGHDKSSDYWALGVLVYELFVGKSPFYRPYSSQLEMFMRAVNMHYQIPEFVNEYAQDMIKRLLQSKPTERLGNLANGYLDLKRHEWFEASSINFGLIIRKEEAAPWIPQVKDSLDVSEVYEETEQDAVLAETLTETEQGLFEGF